MLRDQNLVSLSHQHQHALALCVRISRGLERPTRTCVESWQQEIHQQFDRELRFHFEAEETILFPEASRFPELKLIVQELMVEHSVLRMYAQKAAERKLERAGLLGFAETLSHHVRKEERELFQRCQELFNQSQLERIGRETDEYFRRAGLGNDA